MLSELYRHVLQHGEEILPQLRGHLASFLQCELSQVCASTACRPGNEQGQKEKQHQHPQKQRHGEELAPRSQEENCCDVVRQGNIEAQAVVHPAEKIVSSANLDKKEGIYSDVKAPVSVEENLPAGEKDEPHYVSTSQRERPSPAEAEETRQPTLKEGKQIKSPVEETERTPYKKGAQGGKEQISESRIHGAGVVKPFSSLTPRSAEDQGAEGRRAGEEEKKALDLQKHKPLAAGKEDKINTSCERNILPQPDAEEQKRCLKQEAANPPSRRKLATFLSTSSPELSRLLEAVFLLECLPPDPLNAPDTAAEHAHCYSNGRCHTQAEEVEHLYPALDPLGEINNGFYREMIQQNGALSLELLPKSSVMSRWLKNVGNALLADQELDAAQRTYTASLRLAPLCAAAERSVPHKPGSTLSPTQCDQSSAGQCSSSRSGQETAGKTAPPYLQDVAVLLSNRSAVRLKQHAPVAALRDATAALQVDSTYSKAWFRRASAFLQLADLFAEECCSSSSPPGGLPEPQAVRQQRKPGSIASLFSRKASSAFPVTPTADELHCTGNSVGDRSDRPGKTAALDTQTCSSIVERILREEAAYSLSCSIGERRTPHPIGNAVSLAAPSMSSPRLTASSSADESGLCSTRTPISSSRTCLSLPPLRLEAWRNLRDGESGTFRLGVCACEMGEEERTLQWAPTTPEDTTEARSVETCEPKDEDLTTIQELGTEATPLQDTQASTLSTQDAAMYGRPADGDSLALDRPAEGGERNIRATRVAGVGAGELCGDLTEKREMMEALCCSEGKRLPAESSFNTSSRVEQWVAAEGSTASCETSRLKEDIAAVAEAQGIELAAGKMINPETRPPKAKTFVMPLSQLKAVNSTLVERETHEPSRNSLESFAVYVHPELERRTDGPLGTSVHWRTGSPSKSHREAGSERRVEDRGPGACLVLQEYPLASYCEPAANGMEFALLPLAEGKYRFLQQWKTRMQETNTVSAGAVCAGCFNRSGWPHQLEGGDSVRAVYRRCMDICRVAVSAAQDDEGRKTDKAKQKTCAPVGLSSNKIPTAEASAAERRLYEKQIEWKCKQVLSQFLASIELVAPCSTCSTAIFCCTRCRDASHHAAVCRGSILSDLCEDRKKLSASYSSCMSTSTYHGAGSEDCKSRQKAAHAKHKSFRKKTSVAAGRSASNESTATAKYQSLVQESSPSQKDKDKQSETDGQLKNKDDLSLFSTLAASRNILGLRLSVASHVVTAYDTDTTTSQSGPSTAVCTATQLPAAGVASCRKTLSDASFASRLTFERPVARLLHLSGYRRESISREIEAAALARTNVGDDPISRTERPPPRESSARIALNKKKNNKPYDIGSRSSLEKSFLERNNWRSETDSYGENGSAADCKAINFCSCTTKGTCGLPVAYTAGGALRDRPRQLARQIFPLFLSTASSFDEEPRFERHPVTRLTGRLPVDADRLCDFIVNAVWIAGEYFLINKSTFPQRVHGLHKASGWKNSLNSTTVRGGVPESVSHGASATSDRAQGVSPAVNVMTKDGSDQRKEERDNLSACERIEEGNANYAGSDVCKTQRADGACWAWLRDPEVLEAALWAYSVAWTNSFAVTRQPDETGGSAAGGALYLFASQFNHSCAPNTLATFGARHPLLTAGWGEEEWRRANSTFPELVRESRESGICLHNQREASGLAAPAPRSGCALRLHYHGCCGRGQNEGEASKRAGDTIKRDVAMDEAPGEELTIAYIAVAGGKRETCSSERRRYLREHAFFDCRCQACEAWMAFLNTTETDGPQGLPALFPLHPDHLQCLPCRRCYFNSKILRTQLTCEPVQTVTGQGVPQGDILSPVVTLLSTSDRKRQGGSPKTKTCEEEQKTVFEGVQRLLLLQKELEDVVALKGGNLLLQSLRKEFSLPEKQRAGTSVTTGTPKRASTNGGYPVSGNVRMCMHRRVTSAASLAALGHSLLPLGDPSSRPPYVPAGRCSEEVSIVDRGHRWMCIRCGFVETEPGIDDVPVGSTAVEALRRSVEESLQVCADVLDPLRCGALLVQNDEARALQLSKFLVRMAHSRGQLSHEVCSVLDIWALWCTASAAIASDVLSKLFLDWSRATTTEHVDRSFSARRGAVAELGAMLGATRKRNSLLAFQLHLGATWVHSLRFPAGWRQPEVCIELYKSAVLAGNTGRVREGLLLAKAAERSGVAAFGPTHQVVGKIRQLCAALQPSHQI